MNIFTSKLKHIKFQNSNSGGVNYEDLKAEQEVMADTFEGIRSRRSTMQEQTPPSVHSYSYGTTMESNQSVGHDQEREMFDFEKVSDSMSNKNSAKSFNTFDID